MRRAYEPTKADLEKAWVLKQSGAQISVICNSLGISRHQYSKNRLKFNDYFVHAEQILEAANAGGNMHERKEHMESHGINVNTGVLHDTPGLRSNSSYIKKKPKKKKALRVIPKKGRPEGATKLCSLDFNLEKVKGWVLAGFTEETIARLMGICRMTLHKYRKQFPELDFTIQNARYEMVGHTVKAMYKRSIGYRFKDTVVGFDRDGIPHKTEVMRHMPANVSAGKHILANTNNWGSEPQRDNTNNRGKILDMLDGIARE